MEIYECISDIFSYVEMIQTGDIVKVESLFNWYSFDKQKLEELRNFFDAFVLEKFFDDFHDYEMVITNIIGLKMDKNRKVWNKLRTLNDILMMDKFISLLLYYGYLKDEWEDKIARLRMFCSLKSYGYDFSFIIDYKSIQPELLNRYIEYTTTYVFPCIEYEIDGKKTNRKAN